MWDRFGALEYLVSLLVTWAAIVVLDTWWRPEFADFLLGEHGIFKAAIGPFVGAGLAFWATKAHDRAKLRREHIAAVRMAVATLSEIANDLAQYRLGLFKRIAVASTQFGDSAPRWVYAFPIFYSFKMDAKLDLASVEFLFEESEAGGELYRLLTNAGRCHAHTHAMAERLYQAAEEMQGRIADASDSDTVTQMTMAKAGAAVGLKTREKVGDLLSAATSSFRASDEADILEAARRLRQIAMARYPDAVIPVLSLPACLRFSALPMIPRELSNPTQHA